MLNQVTMMGRIASDPSLRHTTTTNAAVLNFRIAIDDNVRTETTYFFDVLAWGSRADFIYQYFAKGDMIAISGKLTTQRRRNKEGDEYDQVVVQVDEAYFTGERRRVDYGE